MAIGLYFPKTNVWCMRRFKEVDHALTFAEEQGSTGVVWDGPKRVARWSPEKGREFFFVKKSTTKIEGRMEAKGDAEG